MKNRRCIRSGDFHLFAQQVNGGLHLFIHIRGFHIRCNSDTNERNTRARAMYKKLGYRESDMVPCQFNGMDGVHLVLLEKKL